jgi:hypothetical protein
VADSVIHSHWTFSLEFDTSFLAPVLTSKICGAFDAKSFEMAKSDCYGKLGNIFEKCLSGF